MAWPKAGTVSVVNGSAIVTGTGTSFFGSAQAGWGFVGPDGRVYEVLAVSSGTLLTITPAYQGATAAGQIYALFPTMSLAHDVVASVQALTGTFQAIADGPGQGKFSTDVVKLGDEDTGLGWPSSNEVALKAGGDWQLRLKDSKASGAAVQDHWLDAAIGKLLTAGAFGWGHDAANGSANLAAGTELSAITVTGLYRYASTHTDAPSTAGVVMHLNRIPSSAAGGMVQIAFGNNGEMWIRVQDGAGPVSFEAWRRMDPDRGSGPNGEYVRFPDGTQICTKAITADSGADSVWDFPAAFSTTTNLTVHITARSSANAIIGGARAPSVLAVSWNAHDTAGVRTATPCSLRAEGRWY
ncbi:pyocin knob domain-containing protein [Leisingera sp. M658]|uniref:pyocin knob domain-containing protein n=1 Tax=Leisingera sp. M658 TaxID=2867015 RepID=UPI0021A4758D|nr:pyocin knob domain-containing protein [Leisingera sp. M658]UWQ75996.1 pyocin knob domain-containing protein [Leisingera sp. M658]